jgi:hypothetical protein
MDSDLSALRRLRATILSASGTSCPPMTALALPLPKLNVEG